MSDFKIEVDVDNCEVRLKDTFLGTELSFTSDEIDDVIEMLIQASEKVN